MASAYLLALPDEVLLHVVVAAVADGGAAAQAAVQSTCRRLRRIGDDVAVWRALGGADDAGILTVVAWKAVALSRLPSWWAVREARWRGQWSLEWRPATVAVAACALMVSPAYNGQSRRLDRATDRLMLVAAPILAAATAEEVAEDVVAPVVAMTDAMKETVPGARSRRSCWGYLNSLGPLGHLLRCGVMTLPGESWRAEVARQVAHVSDALAHAGMAGFIPLRDLTLAQLDVLGELCTAAVAAFRIEMLPPAAGPVFRRLVRDLRARLGPPDGPELVMLDPAERLVLGVVMQAFTGHAHAVYLDADDLPNVNRAGHLVLQTLQNAGNLILAPTSSAPLEYLNSWLPAMHAHLVHEIHRLLAPPGGSTSLSPSTAAAAADSDSDADSDAEFTALAHHSAKEELEVLIMGAMDPLAAAIAIRLDSHHPNAAAVLVADMARLCPDRLA
ncbi:uncharacterized protein AMSG_08575 [Thecamonas trahens ATCC 50062]|uniref:F-box domain-containing protein n=1 Tax=Thecamonas trahens ATCC 50062 TaxID=461836 RepID=A0A0L0DJX4_THETB|nr:hypothetical protein AMSG_08575 [Thecamonas trahens ATCC 50062]KNC52699.1 hypothetical protein AMSG_08575 [Thecamonas trahens ATCC 50062]|eukprot:XP_013755020.1 hypothetical protein AMSG_08575 [Thecamonas trahens ATCC 50062]